MKQIFSDWQKNNRSAVKAKVYKAIIRNGNERNFWLCIYFASIKLVVQTLFTLTFVRCVFVLSHLCRQHKLCEQIFISMPLKQIYNLINFNYFSTLVCSFWCSHPLVCKRTHAHTPICLPFHIVFISIAFFRPRTLSLFSTRVYSTILPSHLICVGFFFRFVCVCFKYIYLFVLLGISLVRSINKLNTFELCEQWQRDGNGCIIV